MKEKNPPPPLSGFLRLNQVLELIPISKSTWWAGVNSGKYPQSVKISNNITAWRVSDIKNLIDAINAGNTESPAKRHEEHIEWPPDDRGTATEDFWHKKEHVDLTNSPLSFFVYRPRPQD